MGSKGVKLSIPKPCHESWSDMTETEKGRFCQSCTTEVIDFTGFTDSEILAHFSNNSKPCGRFLNTQINRNITPVRNVERPSTIQFLFGSMLAVLSSKMAFAQEGPKPELVIQLENDSNTEAVRDPECAIGRKTIEGLVVDSASGESLIGANVYIEGTANGCSTDMDGYFRLIVDDKLPDTLSLVVSTIGYERKTIRLNRGSNFEKMEVFLELDRSRVVMMGMMIVDRPPKNVSTMRVKQWLKSIGHW